MKNKTNIPCTLNDYVRKINVFNIIVHDRAQEIVSSDWIARLRKYIITDKCTEPYHQNSNLAERREDILKQFFDILFHETQTDTKYW